MDWPTEGCAQYQQFPLWSKPADCSDWDCRLELGRGLTQQTPVNGDCGLELGKGIPDTWGIVDSEPEAMGICDLGEIIGQLELTYQSLDWTAN